jgi:hypothetical protein
MLRLYEVRPPSPLIVLFFPIQSYFRLQLLYTILHPPYIANHTATDAATLLPVTSYSVKEMTEPSFQSSSTLTLAVRRRKEGEMLGALGSN